MLVADQRYHGISSTEDSARIDWCYREAQFSEFLTSIPLKLIKDIGA